MVVTDTNGDGTGDAILTFPNGESITLVGVPTSEVQDPAQLEAMGIPLFTGDFIVEGTGVGDLIDGAYVGDPDGDLIDNADGESGTHVDTVIGFDGDDTILGGLDSDVLYGGDGIANNDGAQPFDGDDSIDGGDGDDIIFGENGNDTLIGGLGNDNLDGSIGNDSLVGGDGNDSFDGGDGDDTIDGGIGGDYIFGDGLGETGNDSILAGDGNDTVFGLDGQDAIFGGTGADLMLGGGDNDTFTLEDGFGDDTITGGETVTTGTDNDTIEAAAVTTPLTVTYSGDEAGEITDGTDTVTFSEIEGMILTSGDDSVDATADTAGVEVWAGDGNDTVDGGSGDDTVFGFGDDDLILGNDGNDSLDGDAGNDTLDGGTGDDTLVGDLGDDSLTGGDGADQLFGGVGNDTLNVGSDDQAFGGDGDDVFNVTPGDVSGTPLTIVGGEADETLGDTLNITGPATINMTGAEEGTVTWLDGSVLTFSEIENVNYTACFTPGTLIKTALGEVDAADIAKGDVVLTRDNGFQVVRWAAQQKMTGTELRANEALRPVRTASGALGRGAPERDMLVSPQHRVVVSGPTIELIFGEDEVLVAALHLVGRPGITRECPAEGVTYVHFMFDRHEIVMSDGAWTESFQPGDLTIAGLDDAQRIELLTLFPELADHKGQQAYDVARPTLKRYQARVLLDEVL